MELHKKFDDEWYNMYKPLTLENTLLSGGTLTKDISETLDELAAKTSENEKRINTLNNVFVDSTGIEDGDTIAESMTKINDSICWIDLDDDPSVFTTNEGDRLLYNNE